MRLLLLGATGLVGHHVLVHALNDHRVARLVAPTRKRFSALVAPASTPFEKLENHVIDFDHLRHDAEWWACDAVICTLGTTIRKAGSQAAFRKVDFDYVVNSAAIARGHGARAFALTSSLGANSSSGNFYLRTKGEVEEALKNLGFESLTIVRPSLLVGNRSEVRPMERLSAAAMKIFRPVIPKRYRAVEADAVAQRLLEAAITAAPGTRIIESEGI